MIPTLFLVTVLVFFSLRFIPGSTLDLMLAEISEQSGMGSELTVEYLKERLGLTVPLHIQYARWLGVWPDQHGKLAGILEGDLGDSLWRDESVNSEIAARIPVSFELGLFAIVTAMLIAIPIGVLSAIRQDTFGDYLGRSFAVICISVPGFWLGTIVMVYPSIWWHWAPAMEYIPFFEDPWGNLVQFFIPGFLTGMVMSGTTMRMTRTMMLEVLRQDYIRTAWSKGLSERTVVIRHAMKNALIPVVTIAGSMIPVIIGGEVIMEQIFSLPGVGRLLYEALTRRDYPVISGINVVVAVVVLFCNLIVDVIYGWLDPRIHYT